MNGIHEIRELWPERRLDLLAVLPNTVNTTTPGDFHADAPAIEKAQTVV